MNDYKILCVSHYYSAPSRVGPYIMGVASRCSTFYIQLDLYAWAELGHFTQREMHACMAKSNVLAFELPAYLKQFNLQHEAKLARAIGR